MEDIQAESLLKMDQPLQKVYERLDSKETEAILSRIKMHLELEGYLVMTATEGREALTQLSNAPDLILLDINMQGMNGIDLCSSIRDYDNVVINGREYRTADYLDNMPISDAADFQITKSYYIIFSSQQLALEQWQTGKEEGNSSELSYVCGIDAEEPFDKDLFMGIIRSFMDEQDRRGDISSRDETYEWQLAMYSAFLFVGIGFSILFLFMMAFVVYYKQIERNRGGGKC